MYRIFDVCPALFQELGTSVKTAGKLLAFSVAYIFLEGTENKLEIMNVLVLQIRDYECIGN